MSDIPMGSLIQELMHPILGVSVEQFQNNPCSLRGGMFTSWWGCTVQLDHKHLKFNGKLTSYLQSCTRVLVEILLSICSNYTIVPRLKIAVEFSTVLLRSWLLYDGQSVEGSSSFNNQNNHSDLLEHK
jgi:hypothetical protein